MFLVNGEVPKIPLNPESLWSLFRLRVRNHSHLLSSFTWRGEVGLPKEQSILRLNPQKRTKNGRDPNGRPLWLRTFQE